MLKPSLEARGLLASLDSVLAGGNGVFEDVESNWKESNSDSRSLILLFRGLWDVVDDLLPVISNQI